MADRLTTLTLQHALRLADQNEHARALEIIEALEVTLGEPSQEVTTTRGQIEKQMLDLLRPQFPSRSMCFIQACSAAELRNKCLRAKDAFVWTHCDGATPLSDLVDIVQDELQTLYSLSRLLNLGVLLKPTLA